MMIKDEDNSSSMSESLSNYSVYELIPNILDLYQITHQLPLTLGGRQVQSFIPCLKIERSNQCFPVFVIHLSIQLREDDRILSQIQIFVKEIYKRHRELFVGQSILFADGTSIGSSTYAGVILTSIPKYLQQDYYSSLPQSSSFPLCPPSSYLFCLLLTSDELNVVQETGLSRLTAQIILDQQLRKDKIECEFVISNDLMREDSYVIFKSNKSSNLTPVAQSTVSNKEKVERVGKLSKKEQLKLKLKQKQGSNFVMSPNITGISSSFPSSLSYHSSILDSFISHRLTGVSIIQQSTSLTLSLPESKLLKNQVKSIIHDSMEKSIPINKRKGIVFLTDWRNCHGKTKVWNVYIKDKVTNDNQSTIPSNISSAKSNIQSPVYGNFLCIFPTSSTIDEARSIEDGFVLMLSNQSYTTLLNYLSKGMRMSILADTKTGLNIDFIWRPVKDDNNNSSNNISTVDVIPSKPCSDIDNNMFYTSESLQHYIDATPLLHYITHDLIIKLISIIMSNNDIYSRVPFPLFQKYIETLVRVLCSAIKEYSQLENLKGNSDINVKMFIECSNDKEIVQSYVNIEGENKLMRSQTIKEKLQDKLGKVTLPTLSNIDREINEGEEMNLDAQIIKEQFQLNFSVVFL